MRILKNSKANNDAGVSHRGHKARPLSSEGYNSDDEHPTPEESIHTLFVTEEELEEADQDFEASLRARNFEMVNIKRDGNCLFRSVADQVYGDQEMHDVVRKNCMDLVEKSRDTYSQFVAEDFDQYVHRKRQNYVFGNHLEIQAISELYNRPIEIYEYNKEPIVMNENTNDSETNFPIRLSYHNGVGLGLPNLEPGLADKIQLEEAKKESVCEDIEQTLVEQIKEESEQQVIDQLLEQQILEESYVDFDQEQIEQSIIMQSLEEYYNKERT